jgi:N-methylhydantoinase B
MTNTMNTPIEVTEASYPVVFTSYTVRGRSGGRGRFKGGDGIVRSFKVTAPARLSILASRFRHRPWGITGGSPGKPAKVRVVRADGRVEEVVPMVTLELGPGDEVIIETPGGGGYGPEGGISPSPRPRREGGES